MHLICAEFLRSAGRTEWAGTHLEMATSLLEGRPRVDALRLAATVADDAQHPQVAERIVAAAEWEAIQVGETSELGSLLTLRARVLNRIGFAEEAEAALRKGEALLEEASTPQQRFTATQNKAWLHFDRGEVSLAEVEFARLRDAARQLEGDASVADKEAWRARALFASGRPEEALQAIRVVEELAAVEDVEAPVFLAQLALTEGNLAFGRFDDALSASELVLDLVERQLPAWENMARSHRASAFLRRGSIPEAGAEIARALTATPPGADGWRWRIRCLALQIEIDAKAGKPWRADEAEDLVDLMLQSRFYGWAAELLCAIAERGKRAGAAAEAAAVAMHAGLPMVAARAIHAGSLWGDPVAIPVILAVRAVEKRLPAGWEADWRAIPHVAGALEAPEPTADEESAAVTAAMDEALRGAGLAGDAVVLSPAQRRSRGLVRRSRALRPVWAVAAALGVVVLAAATALGVAQMTQEEAAPPPTTTPEVVTTEPLVLEETQVAVAADVRTFFGTVEHRGGYGRGGSVDYQGPRSVSGYYWKVRTAGPIEAAPIAFGRYLYVGSTEGTVYGLDQTTGDEIWTMTPEGRVSAAPALGQAVIGEGTNPMMVVVVDDDGVVRGHRADTEAGGTWVTHLGARIRSSPVVVDGVVLVATTGGFIHGLDLVSGEQMWRYPDDEAGLGPISADLAYHNGLLYAGTEEGILHVLDVGSDVPALVCQFDALQPILSNPMVVDDIVYVPTRGQNIWTLPAGRCDGIVPGRLPFYVTETPVEVAPAIVGDTIYLPDGLYLYSKDLTTNDFLWPPAKVKADSPISTPPVVAGDVVVFASEDGVVHAVDALNGDLLWQWRTGLHVRGSPVVIDGVV
ncbi:MAG: PQQ-binding-like beta-propeller repeat protein, partial [Acidimicrobiia bacterium]